MHALNHTATLLPNGNVLAAGGIFDHFGNPGSAELYNQASGTWATAGSLGTARDNHTATLLPNGKVLVAGGVYTSILASAELYDPASGDLVGHRQPRHCTRIITQPHCCPTAKCSSQAERAPASFIAERGTLRSSERDLVGHRQPRHRTLYHTATLLPNGKVLVAGGNGNIGISRERGTLRSGDRDLGGHR